MMASWAGYDDVCLFLLAYKPNPDQQDNAGYTAMHHAILGDYDKIVRLLLQHGADGTIETHDGTSCVTLASHVPAPQSMKALSSVALAMGTSDMANLLTASAYDGNVEILKSLIEDTKFDPNVQDTMGHNAAHLAAIGGNLDALVYLHGRGTRLDALDSMGRGIVEYAAMGSNLAIVDKVLKLVVPSVDQGADTWSPLHWACRLGDVDVIQSLLEYGFNPTTVQTAEPNHLWHPLDIAEFYENTRLLEHSGFDDKLGPRSPHVPQLLPTQKETGYSCDACQQVSVFDHYINCANVYSRLLDRDSTLAVRTLTTVSCVTQHDTWLILQTVFSRSCKRRVHASRLPPPPPSTKSGEPRILPEVLHPAS